MELKIDPDHHMQEAMLQMLMRTNLKTEQEIKTVLKREVQKETQENSHPKEEIRQVKRGNYPVKHARKLHTQIFLGVQTSRNIYQESQMEQIVYPRKYAGYALEPYSAIADIAA